MLFVLNGPSAGGKTTMAKLLSANSTNYKLPLERIVTATTRKPRDGEIDRIDYHFLTSEQFNEWEREGHLVEKNLYSGNYYGTPKKSILPFKDKNHHAIIVLDFWGYAKCVEFLGKDNVKLAFIYASEDEIRNRMKERGDADSDIDLRILRAREKDFVGLNFADVVINTEELNTNEAYDKLYKYIHNLIG